MPKVHDAVVIGGGPAGSGTALLLARSGWQVALVERSVFPRRKVCGEFVSATNVPVLARAGAADSFLADAGPEVRQLGVFAGDSVLTTPAGGDGPHGWGRALSRERLDTLLLDRCVAADVAVWQPWSAVTWSDEGDCYACRLVSKDRMRNQVVRGRIVIGAHGSWEPGKLPTQAGVVVPSGADLLAFKSHWRQARLAPGLMPLLAFPGGYGGMVHGEDERVSLSFCIRRDQLQRCRARSTRPAADAAFAHILESCAGAREALLGAERDGPWLAAGPIRPGIRDRSIIGTRIFTVGNAAGEAHPVIAEGISMAMQAAWLLCRSLTEQGTFPSSPEAIAAAQAHYAFAWRRQFVGRIRASQLIAAWAMSPLAVRIGTRLLRGRPALLSVGAGLGGKDRAVPEAAAAALAAR